MEIAALFAGLLVLVLLALFVVLLGLWPGSVARRRHHPNADAIAICGLLGLLFTGGLLWVVAAVWAYSVPAPGLREQIRPQRRPEPDDDTKECPYCAETIKAAAIVCKHCGRDVAEDMPEQLASDPAFDKIIEEELAAGPRKWKIEGIVDGKRCRGTITAESAEAAMRGASARFSIITSIEPA